MLDNDIVVWLEQGLDYLCSFMLQQYVILNTSMHLQLSVILYQKDLLH